MTLNGTETLIVAFTFNVKSKSVLDLIDILLIFTSANELVWSREIPGEIGNKINMVSHVQWNFSVLNIILWQNIKFLCISSLTAESFVGKGLVVKGFRRHARRRFGQVKYKYCHYFVTLEEGEPPEHYYPHRRKLTPQEMLEEWLESKRQRTIPMSL